MIHDVVFIGAGNLATQTAIAMSMAELNVIQIYSRTTNSAKALAEKINCSYTTSLRKINKNAGLYIIAVKDSAISEVLMTLKIPEDKLIVHTAGGVSIDILKGYTNHYGVFYPLQTFSKLRHVDFTKIPICIETNHPADFIELQELALRISESVYQINSEERGALHLAAIFACNFVNHFYVVSEHLLKDNKLNFEMLLPLIRETAEKVQQISPLDAQTGPAVRYDEEVIQKNIEDLNNKPDMQKLYSFVTQSIFQFHQKP